MSNSFSDLYSKMLKDVFLDLARQQLEQGADALICADAYAEQGKPDFTLAYLLLIDASDEVKRDIFARSYEQRATLSEQKANDFSLQFHRAFPMIKVEAQKDRQAAQQIRQGKRVRSQSKAISINFASPQ
jgi:hypothetical protein